MTKRSVPWVSGVLKNTSHHGGVRAPVEVVDAYWEERGGLLIVHRDLDVKTGACGFRAYMDYGNVAYHDYVQYLLTPKAYKTIFMIGNANRLTSSGWESLNWQVFSRTPLFKDWKNIDERRRGIELSFLTFYASSRRNINDNTKRNKSPCSVPSVDERLEMFQMALKYPRPEHFTRMKSIEAPPTVGKTQEEDEQANQEEKPSASTPKEQETEPVSPEIDPMNYKEDEGRPVSPTATWTNPPHSGPFSTRENEPSSSSWKQTYDNVRSVKKRAQEMNVCLCCASDAHSFATATMRTSRNTKKTS